MAERIRSSVFFALCGEEASPIHVPSYMRLAHTPDDWMGRVFQEIWNRVPCAEQRPEGVEQKFIDYVRESWIRDQAQYHEKKAKRIGAISRRLERAGKIIFIIALLTSFLGIVLFFFNDKQQFLALDNSLMLFGTILPAVGAALSGIAAHREYARLQKRSRNMAAVLKDLDERYSEVKNTHEFETLLRETEKLMLRENQDWLMLMKFVNLEASV